MWCGAQCQRELYHKSTNRVTAKLWPYTIRTRVRQKPCAWCPRSAAIGTAMTPMSTLCPLASPSASPPWPSAHLSGKSSASRWHPGLRYRGHPPLSVWPQLLNWQIQLAPVLFRAWCMRLPAAYWKQSKSQPCHVCLLASFCSELCSPL